MEMEFAFDPNKNDLLRRKRVELDGDASCVPYVVDGDTWLLKTIYPSRNFK
jgi:hypothetical protein